MGFGPMSKSSGASYTEVFNSAPDITVIVILIIIVVALCGVAFAIWTYHRSCADFDHLPVPPLKKYYGLESLSEMRPKLTPSQWVRSEACNYGEHF